MAIGQARNEFVKRSEGKNICQKAAYIDRSQIQFEGTKFQEKKLYDYSNRPDLLTKKILLPEGASERFSNPETLWNAAEQIEKQHNSQVGMEFVIALPDDKVITEEDRIILTERFAEIFINKGLAAHYAIHRPHEKEDHNWHAHLLVPTRTFSQDGQELNHLKDRSLQKEIANTRWGEVWTKMQNDYFKELGLDLRVDPKSLNPQEHLGAVRLRGHCLDMLERHEENLRQNAIDASNPAKILQAISMEKAVWQVQDVERFLSKHTPPEKVEEVRDQFWRLNDIVKLQEPYQKYGHTRYRDNGKYTTLEVLKEEKQILRRCENINDVEHIKLKDKHLDKFSDNLNPEQLQAYRSLSSRSGFGILEGYAGSGKSHVLAALKEVYESRGVTVRGFGPDNATANLLKEKRFNAENVPRFLYAQEHGLRDIKKKEVWIVDEGGKLGNQALNELCRVAQNHKAKLILAGDSAQMPSIDRGGMFQYLAKEYNASKLTDIQRQENQSLRDISQSFAEGDVEKALSGLKSEKCLHFESDKSTAMEKLIVDWSFNHYINKEKNLNHSLILATSNREVHILNQAAHDVRMVKGELKDQEYSCKTSFGEVRVAEGDLIEFRKNDRAIGVTNGLKGALIEAGKDRFTVEVDLGATKSKIVSFDPQEYGSWQLGYATTTYRSQGRTVDDAYVLHNPLNSKQTSYVAMSRHRENLNVYIDKEECNSYGALKEQCMKDSSKESSLSFENEYDLNQQKQRENFDRSIDQANAFGSKWTRFKAFFKVVKDDIENHVDYYKMKSADKRDSHEFYGHTQSKETEQQEYGVSKLPELKIYGIEKEAMDAIEEGLAKQAEEELLKEAIAARQEMQLEKLAIYQDYCQSEGFEEIKNIENIFTPENERSIVVLCASQQLADNATEICKQEGFVFLSLEKERRDPSLEKEIDLSALEDRKVLVCGSEEERNDILEALGEQKNLHIQETSYNFASTNEFEFEEWQDAEAVLGDWKEVENKEKSIDIDLGIEKDLQIQRGFDLSL